MPDSVDVIQLFCRFRAVDRLKAAVRRARAIHGAVSTHGHHSASFAPACPVLQRSGWAGVKAGCRTDAFGLAVSWQQHLSPQRSRAVVPVDCRVESCVGTTCRQARPAPRYTHSIVAKCVTAAQDQRRFRNRPWPHGLSACFQGHLDCKGPGLWCHYYTPGNSRAAQTA